MTIVAPHDAIKEEWIVYTGTTPVNECIDGYTFLITLDGLSKALEHMSYHVAKENSVNRGYTTMLPLKSRRQGHEELEYWKLSPNSLFVGWSDVMINLPSDIVGTIYARQIHNHNGLLIPQTLYTHKDKGALEFSLINQFGETFLNKGVVIGTLVLTL